MMKYNMRVRLPMRRRQKVSHFYRFHQCRDIHILLQERLLFHYELFVSRLLPCLPLSFFPLPLFLQLPLFRLFLFLSHLQFLILQFFLIQAMYLRILFIPIFEYIIIINNDIFTAGRNAEFL